MEQQRTRGARRAALVAAAAALGVLGACGTDRAVTATTATTTTTATPAVTTTATPAVTSSAVVPAGATSRAARPVPLPLTDAVRAQLVAAYVRENGDQPSWIAGLAPGTSYYAVEPGTGVELAWVTFRASATAPERVLVALQDEGSRTALRRVPGGSWTVYDICRTPGFLALTGGVLPAGGRCATP